MVASRDMEAELVCVDSYGKKAGLGVLDGGGFMFSVPLHTVRYLYRMRKIKPISYGPVRNLLSAPPPRKTKNVFLRTFEKKIVFFFIIFRYAYCILKDAECSKTRLKLMFFMKEKNFGSKGQRENTWKNSIFYKNIGKNRTFCIFFSLVCSL